ncbi:MAG TPA: Txe/YoeB family addiction module toxin [Prolixibacteraceae bacterium]|jgi:toxin YoeB
MILKFSKIAWEDYISWQFEDKSMVKRINELIKDIQRTPYEGKGKPEALKYDLSGYWARRIDREHRLVYRIEENDLAIYSCKYHYDN